MLKLIGELKVCHLVFGHNSHSQVREVLRDQGDQVICWTCPTDLRFLWTQDPPQFWKDWLRDIRGF